jgi:hypothetical protein
MDWKQHVAAAALVVSIGSCTLSYNLSHQTAVTSVRPVLVFQYDLSSGWSLRNVGNGPALDVLVAMKKDDHADWTQPMRVPPLPKDGQFGLQKWPVYGSARVLGSSYLDVQQRQYSTTCINDLSAIHEGNALKTWPDDAIHRYWAS